MTYTSRTHCGTRVRLEAVMQIMTCQVPHLALEVSWSMLRKVNNQHSKPHQCNNHRCQACSSDLTPTSFLLTIQVKICKERKRWSLQLKVHKPQTARTRGCRTCHPVCFHQSWTGRPKMDVSPKMPPSIPRTTWRRSTQAGTPPRSSRGCWRDRVSTEPPPCMERMASGPGSWTSQPMILIYCRRDRSCFERE